jgi:hypothetical protein
VAGVAGEIDEDIEIVRRDERGRARVVEPREDAPRHPRLDSRIALGALRIVEVGEHAESLGVVRREDAADERRQRGVRVGRQVAQAQRAVGHVDARSDGGARRDVALDPARPFAMRLQDRFRRAVGDELQRCEPVRRRGGERRVRLERAAVGGDRLADAAGLLQQVAEVVVRGRARRVEGDRALERVDRPVGIADALARVAEVDPGRRRARIERDRRLQRTHRLAGPPRAVERGAEVHAIGGVARRERHRALERVDRDCPPARRVSEHAKPVPRPVQPRIAFERLPVARFRLGPSRAVERARLVEDFGRGHRGRARAIVAGAVARLPSGAPILS